AGQTAGVVTTEVAGLMQGVNQVMFVTRLRLGALWCVLLVAAGVTGAGLFALHAGAAKPAETVPAAQAAPAGPKEEARDLVFSGRVPDPDGKPFAGAKLYLTPKSSIHKPPRLKDPTTRTHEYKTVNGKTESRIVHPNLVAVLKRFGLDPDKPLGEELENNPK